MILEVTIPDEKVTLINNLWQDEYGLTTGAACKNHIESWLFDHLKNKLIKIKISKSIRDTEKEVL